MKKWKWIFPVITVAAAAPMLVYAAGWIWSFREGVAVELPAEAVLARTERLEVGVPVTGSVEFMLPLHRSVERALLRPGDGSLAIGSVRIERAAWRFTRWMWRVSFDLCALREGAVKSGALEIELAGAPPERAVVAIPGFSAVLTPPKSGERELELAGALEPPQASNRLWWIGGCGAIAAAAAIVLVLLRRRRMPEISLQDRTLALLSALKLDWNEKRIAPEAGVAQLTDIVRGYLEERFGIMVSTRTTTEFSADLDRDDSPLPDAEKRFLRDFLEAADRVKFAALPPETGLFEQAFENACRLVESTRPPARKETA